MPPSPAPRRRVRPVLVRFRHFSTLLLVAVALLGVVPLRGGIYRNTISPGNVPWPGGVVPYEWDASVTPAMRPTYLAGLREWELAADIQFVEKTTQATYVRLVFDPLAPSGSYTASPPTLTMVNLSRRLVCHESGHALGFEHEHSRPDRDTFITVNLANIVDAAEVKFEKFLAGDVTTHGSYDFESVMHYQRTEYLEPVLDPDTESSMVPNAPNDVLYFNRLSNHALSPGDRATAAFLYGAGPVLSPVVTNTQDTGVGSLRAAIYYANEHPGTPITFAIPVGDPGNVGGVCTIKLTGHLPPLVAAGTVIDGSSQPGYAGTPLIALSGEDLIAEAGDVDGLLIFAANCVVRALAIHGFTDNGIGIFYPGATDNVIEGCFIGLKPDGTTADPNTRQGVATWGGAQNNDIGTNGVLSTKRNVISGNAEYGVLVLEPDTTGNTIAGNYIGTNAAGTAAVPNQKSGVAFWGGAHDNTIGGSTAAARNVISGNSEYGVWLSEVDTTNNLVAGNYIGTNNAGTSPIANALGGLILTAGPQGNTVGGGNVISGNTSYGVLVIGAGTTGNVVTGNLIGLNAAGTAALGNDGTGVAVWGGATNNTIGGSVPAARNFISSNLNYGVIILDAGTSGNVVAGNAIGLALDGGVFGNSFAGVALWNGSTGNTVGGAPNEGNLITANGWAGVAFFEPAAVENPVLGNQIFENGGLGIRVDPSPWIAAPTITSASVDTTTHINGTFTPSGAGDHRIEFFANLAGEDEGRYFLGAVDDDASPFAVDLATIVPANQPITATVTDPAGNTSPFSAAFVPAFVDNDSDGMPDDYENAHGLDDSVDDANDDADGDGHSNIAEMHAGTDPQIATDVFGPLQVVMTPNGAEITLPDALPGRTYRFEVKDDLTGAWTVLATGLAVSTAGPITALDTAALTQPQRFYRAVVEP